jgi:hypothetical protein
VPRTPRRILFTVLLGLALLVPGTAIASNAPVSSTTTICSKQVMLGWYAGSIPTTYAVNCYQTAIRNLSTVNQLYSSAHDDIQRAMLAAIAHKKGFVKSANAVGVVSTKDALAASSSGVTSFPLPLLILGGLAILLVAAGGIGLLVRRFQSPPPDAAA